MGFLMYHPTFLLFSVRILISAVPQLPPPKTATLSLLFKIKWEMVGFCEGCFIGCFLSYASQVSQGILLNSNNSPNP